MYVEIYLINQDKPVVINEAKLLPEETGADMIVYRVERQAILSHAKHRFNMDYVVRVDVYPEDRIKMTAMIGSELKVRYVEDDKEVSFLMEAGWTKA